jgi:hypothetical protein
LSILSKLGQKACGTSARQALQEKSPGCDGPGFDKFDVPEKSGFDSLQGRNWRGLVIRFFRYTTTASAFPKNVKAGIVFVPLRRFVQATPNPEQGSSEN